MCLLENAVRCDKKAVFAGSLEGQLCQIQLLCNKNDTLSETNITITQRGFKSQIGYAKTMDLKHWMLPNVVTIFTVVVEGVSWILQQGYNT